MGKPRLEWSFLPTDSKGEIWTAREEVFGYRLYRFEVEGKLIRATGSWEYSLYRILGFARTLIGTYATVNEFMQRAEQDEALHKYRTTVRLVEIGTGLR